MLGTFNSLLAPKIIDYGAKRPITMIHKVFVYGTLKRNEPNHHWLLNKDNGLGHFHGNGSTITKYPLIIATKYNIPFLLKYPGNGYNVKGEVYEVDEMMLHRLDILKDHPNYYEREQDDIIIYKNDSPTDKVKCWVYFLTRFKPELLTYPMMESYSSMGSHGKPYLESANESTIDDLNDVPK